MLLHDTVGLRQAQSGAALAFRGEEGLEDAGLDVARHAGARVGHGHDGPIALRARGQADLAPVRERIHGVQDEVGQRFPQRVPPPLNDHALLDIHLQVDATALGLRRVAPLWRRQLGDLAEHSPDVDTLAWRLAALVGKRQQPLDRLSAIHGRLNDRVQVLLGDGRVVLALERQARHLAIARDQREGLVQVVGDAAGHLTQRAQFVALGQLLSPLLCQLALAGVADTDDG